MKSIFFIVFTAALSAQALFSVGPAWSQSIEYHRSDKMHRQQPKVQELRRQDRMPNRHIQTPDQNEQSLQFKMQEAMTRRTRADKAQSNSSKKAEDAKNSIIQKIK